MSLILASTSPRRKELLSLITTDFKVVGSDFAVSYTHLTLPTT